MAKPLKVTPADLSVPGSKRLKMVGLPRELQDCAQIFLRDGLTTQLLQAGVPVKFNRFEQATPSVGLVRGDPGNDRIIMGRAGIWFVFFQCSLDAGAPPSNIRFQAKLDAALMDQVKCQDGFNVNKIDSCSMSGLVKISAPPNDLTIEVESSSNIDIAPLDAQLTVLRVGL